MKRWGRIVGVAIIGLGIAAVVIGVALVVEGQAKANYIKEQMRAEQVTTAILGVPGADPNNLIDSAVEAEAVANRVKEHRLSIAPTYADLMAMSPTGRYDPSIPAHLTYNQAMNLENYLYLGVASLGLTTVTTVSGVSMMVIGLALALTGLVLYPLTGRSS